MKMKGAKKISIFFITLLILCSFSFFAFADTNEWGYNDSYINSVSSEDNELYFIPLAPDSQYTDYLVVIWKENLYLVTGDGDFLVFGNGLIQRPNPAQCYEYTKSSNSWVACDFPRYSPATGLYGFDRTMEIVDVTSNLEHWASGVPIQETSIINRTGYRLYWNITLILLQILNTVNYFADYIMSVVLLRYLCVAALAGEFIIFIVIILRRLGTLRNEEADM